MRIGRREVAALFGAAMLVMPAACGSDGGNDPDADPTQSSTPSASVDTDSKKCRAAQRDMAWMVRQRLQPLTQRALSQPDQVPADATEPLRLVSAQTARSSRKECGGDPTALVPMTELVQRAIDDGLDEPLLRQIVEAFEKWGRTVGAQPRLARIIYHADPCVPLRKHLNASYEIRRRAESGGVAVWVEIVLTNDWWQEIYLDHGGSIRATGVRPDGATRTYSWGGSSADTAAAAAGRTSRTPIAPVPAVGPTPYLHLFPDGDVVFDVYGSAYGNVGPCGIDLEPAESS